MSLEAESPLHSSSSSDDFVGFLNTELELAALDSANKDAEVNNDHTNVIEEPSRIFLKVIKDTVEIEGPRIFSTVEESTGEEELVVAGGSCDFICRKNDLRRFQDLKLATSEIDRLRGADLKSLLREKKLVLILDLDHTLLNSTVLTDVSAEEQYLLREAESLRNAPERSLLKLDGLHILTKLRPFVHNFLKEANTMFDMYIYTMAERSYALEIVKHLDPMGVYFNCKVISQSDSTQRYLKGLDVVLKEESHVVILDDTKIVWNKHSENLILMEKYHFFASSCRIFGLGIKSLSELRQDERESDGALANILGVLKRVHQKFFDPVLKRLRQEILHGCVIVFSRVFYTTSPPEEEAIWKMAEQLGAICLKEVDASVTHIVSLDPGTQKSWWALKNNKFLVNPRWIEAANFMWRRQPEENFPEMFHWERTDDLPPGEPSEVVIWEVID
ncbi:RNA polymerase II C-terminal domain phosphatase-like 4 [Dendrobium catenatum]|uniref:RNA polymerase II C-terminal domain phosphatase-like n=1 Tax=Dendrobium catenatum TaxID=906689 RepID=A0A2I0X4C9_9ASPA|nr:RNA polymerase II C-terminal domain phosphatase-like 4 [Dendrobium catenatum]